MATPKFDGVVEAVHYKPDGEVDWVRIYMRRGSTFSDYVILNRPKVLEYLKAGKKLMIGRRVPQMASTFEISKPITLMRKDGKDLLVSGNVQPNRDCLEGAPLI